MINSYMLPYHRFLQLCHCNFILMIFILFASCKDPKPSNTITQIQIHQDSLPHKTIFPYDLTKANSVLIPPKELNEISGLTFDVRSNSLFSVNDEKGKIYVLDTDSGRIKKEYKFGKSGDYEGIELIDSIAFVVKSNGQLSSYSIKDNKALSKIKSGLAQSNDIEGLGMSKDGKHLLLACKANPGSGLNNDQNNWKAVYSFDLESKELSQYPYLSIQQSDLLAWLEDKAFYNSLSKFKQKNYRARLKKFAPSGIAVHPLSKDYYIVSAQGKSLIVIDEDHVIKHIQFLKDEHAQAEGICFDERARLFISNEARGLSPKIFIYESLSN